MCHIWILWIKITLRNSTKNDKSNFLDKDKSFIKLINTSYHSIVINEKKLDVVCLYMLTSEL